MSRTPPRSQNGASKTGTELKISSQSTTPHPLLNHDNVFLFIPNIIGYTRVLLAASSLYFMRWHPKYCTWLYIVSCLLDAFDGMAARRFGQSISISFNSDVAQQASLALYWIWSRIVVRQHVFYVIYVLRIPRIQPAFKPSSPSTLHRIICICIGIIIRV
jgi:hypothetical protein